MSSTPTSELQTISRMDDMVDRPPADAGGADAVNAEFVLLKVGEHWLEESADDGALRVVASPTPGSLFLAEAAEGSYRLRACGSARPLVTDGGVLALGVATEPGSLLSLPMAEWSRESPGTSEGAVPATAQTAKAGDLAGYRIAPEILWDDREHKQLIEDAFAALMLMPDDKAGVQRVKALWSHADFRAGVLQGLHDADYLGPYTNRILGAVPTYASHFFDPDTKQNWAPLLFPTQTAYSETIRFAQDAANLATNMASGGKVAARSAAWDVGAESVEPQPLDGASAPPSVPNSIEGRCGYKLGLALHYFSDLTQPMHAANVVNAVWAGDWRHQGFERGADARGPAFRIDPRHVKWTDVDPGAMQYVAQLVMEVARNSKRIYKAKVQALMETKVHVTTAGNHTTIVYDNRPWGPEIDPVLQEAIPAGQLAVTKFLVLWGRTSAFHGAWFVGKARTKPWSDHAPFFFSFRGRTYLLYVDTYMGKNDVYVQPFDSDVPAEKITSGVKGVPSVVEFEGRLVMAFAHGKTVQCLASLDARNWTAAPAPANAQILQHSRPALCVHEGRLFMVWVDPQKNMHWSTRSPGQTTWAGPGPMPGRLASHSPTLAVFNKQLYVAWTGKNDIDWIYYSRFEGGGWTSQDNLAAAGVASNSGPALIAEDGLLLAFYRRPGDNQVCVSKTTNGRVWDGGQRYVDFADDPSESDIVASPLPDQSLVGWSRAHTLLGGYKGSHRLMCAPVGRERSGVEIPDGALVRASGRAETYVVCGYAKFHIPSPDVFRRMNLQEWDVRRIPVEVVNALTSTPTDGSLLRELSDPKVWYMVAGARLHVENPRELTQLAAERSLRYVVIPDGTVATVPEKYQRESVAIKVSVDPGQPVGSVPLRGWRIFNLVRVQGEVKRSPVDISSLNDDDLRRLVDVALIAPQSALRTPETP